MMVENAKIAKHKVTMCFPSPGKPRLKANEVSEELFSPLDQASGKRRITKAVMEHITMVSKNTPDMEINPWFKGLSVLAAACAIGVLPNPASLENTPLVTP